MERLLLKAVVSEPAAVLKEKALRSVSQGLGFYGAQGRNRTIDTRIFSPLLYRLSYLGKRRIYLIELFGTTVNRFLLEEKCGFFPMSRQSREDAEA